MKKVLIGYIIALALYFVFLFRAAPFLSSSSGDKLLTIALLAVFGLWIAFGLIYELSRREKRDETEEQKNH